MAIQLSTGVRDHLCVTGSLSAAITGLVLKLYSGPPPVSADSALPGSTVLLCTISANGTGAGLTFEPNAVSGVLVKNTAETWEGTVATTGTAGFYRLCTSADAGTASTTAIRIQGTVASINADLLISNPSLVAAAVQRVGSYTLAVPAQ